MYKAPKQFNGQTLESSAFDTPEAKATTAFVAQQSAAMVHQIEADKRRVKPTAPQVDVNASAESTVYTYETIRSGR